MWSNRLREFATTASPGRELLFVNGGVAVASGLGLAAILSVAVINSATVERDVPIGLLFLAWATVVFFGCLWCWVRFGRRILSETESSDVVRVGLIGSSPLLVGGIAGLAITAIVAALESAVAPDSDSVGAFAMLFAVCLLMVLAGVACVGVVFVSHRLNRSEA